MTNEDHDLLAFNLLLLRTTVGNAHAVLDFCTNHFGMGIEPHTAMTLLIAHHVRGLASVEHVSVETVLNLVARAVHDLDKARATASTNDPSGNPGPGSL
jgi:hypothetical protein